MGNIKLYSLNLWGKCHDLDVAWTTKLLEEKYGIPKDNWDIFDMGYCEPMNMSQCKWSLKKPESGKAFPVKKIMELIEDLTEKHPTTMIDLSTTVDSSIYNEKYTSLPVFTIRYESLAYGYSSFFDIISRWFNYRELQSKWSTDIFSDKEIELKRIIPITKKYITGIEMSDCLLAPQYIELIKVLKERKDELKRKTLQHKAQ